MPGTEKTLKAREFLFICEELALAALGNDQTPPHRRVMWTILQLHYGQPAIHFELQPQPARGIVEVGLHFEASADVNDAWAAHIASRAAEVLGQLGPGWELEAWTASWRRVHRAIPIERLTPSFAREVAAAYARVIEVLGPLVAAGLPPEARSVPAQHLALAAT